MTSKLDRFLTRRRVLAGVAGGTAAIAGCSTSDDDSTNGSATVEVVVGSKTFTEQEILGYMLYEAITTGTDAVAVDRIGYGTTSELWDGLTSGDIDVFWEYTGTTWETHPPQRETQIDDPDELFEKVASDVSEEDITVLSYAPFNNTYVLATTQAFANETGIETLSGLASYINDGNTDFEILVATEFSERSDGWPGLVDHYSIDEDALATIDDEEDNFIVGDLGLSYEYLHDGETDVGMAFATDPRISAYDLHVLEDDEKFFPIYNPAPMIRDEVLDAVPEIESILDKLGPAIDGEEVMQELNAKVTLNGENPRIVAQDFLQENGIVED